MKSKYKVKHAHINFIRGSTVAPFISLDTPSRGSTH